MRFVVAVLATTSLVATVFFAGLGCVDEGVQTSLVIEVAPTPNQSACEANGATDCCGATDWPTPDVGCVHITVKQAGPSGALVPLRPLVEGAYGDTAGAPLTIPVDPGGVTFGFRADVDSSVMHSVDVVLYGRDGTPIATGAEETTLGGTVRLRVYPVQEVSCAGPTSSGARRPVARAFHEATELPNGDVLVYGGVTTLGELSDAASARLVEQVEVYLADEERFAPVEVAGELFQRVFFSAIPLPGGDPDTGPFRIKVVGGFGLRDDANPSSPVLRVDKLQDAAATYHGSPVLPTDGTVTLQNRLLTYDPASRRLTVESAADSGVPLAGFNASAPCSARTEGGCFGASMASPVVLGVLDQKVMAGMVETPQRRFAPSAVFLQAGDGAVRGMPMPLSAGRWGATVSRISDAPERYLVWGGNVDTASDVEVESFAGELLDPSGAPTPVSGGGFTGRPAPVAFHSASTFFDSGPSGRQVASVLIAGGLRVGCKTCGMLPFRTDYADPPMAVLRFDGGSVVSDGTPADAVGYTATVFHAAVPLDNDRIALLGGAQTPLALNASRQTVQVVRRGAGSYTIEALTPSIGAAGLLRARFGHAATAFGSGSRILVTGGFSWSGMNLETISDAEVISYTTAPPDVDAMRCLEGGTGVIEGMDAGPPPPPDTGPPPPVDSGAPTDGAPLDGGG